MFRSTFSVTAEPNDPHTLHIDLRPPMAEEKEVVQGLLERELICFCAGKHSDQA
jgi:hypothetical protein